MNFFTFITINFFLDIRTPREMREIVNYLFLDKKNNLESKHNFQCLIANSWLCLPFHLADP